MFYGSIGGTILTIMMVIVIASVIEGKMFGYISIVSMVLSASALILLGIVRVDKPMRITATIMLLLSTWILVNSLSVLNNTMGNVLALLISGLIVLGISIICSKVEKTAALKEKLKKE